MSASNRGNRCRVMPFRACRLFTGDGLAALFVAAFKITDENNGLAKVVYQATLKLSVPRAIRRVPGGLGMECASGALRGHDRSAPGFGCFPYR
ncbi:hypothetical protein AGR9A_Lc80021 [Agrobacterium salinitolerans str. Hayward 0363]|nr:hypothetical protein AGR9A_Lc80021 [Agrobacterium salinitolerans str. Hayward 0363]